MFFAHVCVSYLPYLTTLDEDMKAPYKVVQGQWTDGAGQFDRLAGVSVVFAVLLVIKPNTPLFDGHVHTVWSVPASWCGEIP